MWDAIVIGAGFAGLSTAVALADAGARVLVVEARPTLGGRATAFRDPITGERIDNGQHVLAGCYAATRAFLRRLGTENALHHPAGLRVPMVDTNGVRTTLSLPPLPAPLHLLAGVLAWDALGLRERLAVLRIGPILQRAALAPRRFVSVDETVREWLRRHGQSGRLCELLWEPLALAALNQSIDVASAEPFLMVIGQMFGPDPEGAGLLIPARPLDELYAEPARAAIERAGGEVRASAPARVIFDGSAATGVSIRGEQHPSRVVVSSVPWFALADVAIDAPDALRATMKDAAAMGSAPIVTVNAWFEEAVMDESLLGLPGRTFQWVFDKRRIVASGLTHLSMVSSGAAAVVALSNEEVIAIALRDLASAIPAVRSASLRHASVVREKRATFSLAPPIPPRPAAETGVAGLFLAGDWTDTGLPATIESAVLSGNRAAAAAIEFLRGSAGLKSRPPGSLAGLKSRPPPHTE